jgi:lipopolysaccharide transport system ATP-binding protein
VDIYGLDPALQIGYAIYAEDGELLWWSYHTDTTPENWPSLHLGRVCLRSAVPRRLLNEGRYRIEFVSCLHLREWISQPGGPFIVFDIHGGFGESPLWMESRKSRLAPVLRWQEGRGKREHARVAVGG